MSFLRSLICQRLRLLRRQMRRMENDLLISLMYEEHGFGDEFLVSLCSRACANPILLYTYFSLGDESW